ncbi:MAG: inositol monophosphatase [Anaerolineae bacterium]|nr:inositol monophosphatase [Anaerolineae bacterium]
MTNDLSDLLSVAQETAVTAGTLIRDLLRQPRAIAVKGFRDLVTDADFAAQQQITQTIRQRFPDHGFLTEEEDDSLPTDGPIIWIIDPVDGTTNYSRQQPAFAVSVAAARASSTGYETLAGAIYDPMREELFSAGVGNGATVRDGNGRTAPLHVSLIEQMGDAVLLLDWGGKPALRQRSMAYLQAAAPHVFTVRALGSATLALAWLAAGRADLYFNFNVKAWDLAAAQLILAEAGGVLTAVNGDPLDWQAPVMDCLASNGRLHSEWHHHLTP